MSASLIGRLGSSTFRLSTTTTVSMSLAGSRFSSESAPRPFHHGIRGRGGTILASASSRLRSAISYRCDRSRRIDTWSTSVQIPPRLPWIDGSEQAHRRWREGTRANRIVEIAITRTMLYRVGRRFQLRPQRLAADTAYGAVRLLKWLVDRRRLVNLGEDRSKAMPRSSHSIGDAGMVAVIPKSGM